jgi:hypothetical protein
MVLYRVTLRPLSDETDPDGIRRLKRALKCLLRSFRLRCEGAEAIDERRSDDIQLDRR